MQNIEVRFQVEAWADFLARDRAISPVIHESELHLFVVLFDGFYGFRRAFFEDCLLEALSKELVDELVVLYIPIVVTNVDREFTILA